MKMDSMAGELLDSIPGGFFKYGKESGEIVFISNNLLEMLEFSEEEFKDKFNNNFNNMVYCEDRYRVLSEIGRQIKENGVRDYCEYRVETKSGELKWLFDIGRLSEDEQGTKWFNVIVMDIDPRKKLEDQILLESQKIKP